MVKIVSPPLFSTKGRLNIGQAMTSVCADAFYRFHLLKGEQVHYSSISYNAQGKPMDMQVSFDGNLGNYQEKCVEISNKLIQNMEEAKSRINILPSLERYLDFSEESRKISQDKFLNLFNKEFLIRDKRDFYLDVGKIIQTRDIERILNQIKIQPENFRKTLEQLLHDAITPLLITKHRLFATPIPLYFCPKCSETYPPREIPSDPRLASGTCPNCNEKNNNNVNDTLDPLFDLSVQSYSLNPNDSPADIQICGRNMATRYIYYSLLTHAAIDNLPAFKNLMIHNILNDDSGKRFSNQNKNLININEINPDIYSDAIRYALFKAISFKSEASNLSQNFFEDGQKAVYRIGNLRKFFKTHNVDFSEIPFNEQIIKTYFGLMEDLDLRRSFDFGQEYLSELSKDIKLEHDSKNLGNFPQKAIRYKTAILMAEPFMPEITKKSKEELNINY